MFDFSGKSVLVTGAAGNLGQAVVRAFHDAGANITLVERDDQIIRERLPEIAGAGKHYIAPPTNVTDSEDMSRVVNEAKARFGGIDALINIVGGFDMGTPVHETPMSKYEHMWMLNVETLITSVQAVVPMMLEQNAGKIVNIGSSASFEGKAKMSTYSVAKSAVLRLTQSMSAELKREGINVNAIIPGTIDTPQNREAMPKADFSKWVEPAALADVILFLCSHAARAVHGAAVPVPGLT